MTKAFHDVITQAREDGGKKFYALFSGGKDSVTVAHKLHTEGLLEACIFVDTSICLKETKDFVRDYCKKQGWKLILLDRIGKCKTYEEFVMHYGFPSNAWHNVAMRELKWKPLYYWVMQHKEEGVVLCSGVRSKESKRRMVNTEPYARDKSCKHMRWCAPIYDWSDKEVWAYIHENGLERSPVYSTLGLSGDCLCGAFSSHAEAELISMFHPEMAERIKSLENRCPKERNTWGNQSSMEGAMNQERLSFECADCVNSCASLKHLARTLTEGKDAERH